MSEGTVNDNGAKMEIVNVDVLVTKTKTSIDAIFASVESQLQTERIGYQIQLNGLKTENEKLRKVVTKLAELSKIAATMTETKA